MPEDRERLVLASVGAVVSCAKAQGEALRVGIDNQFFGGRQK